VPTEITLLDQQQNIVQTGLLGHLRHPNAHLNAQ